MITTNIGNNCSKYNFFHHITINLTQRKRVLHQQYPNKTLYIRYFHSKSLFIKIVGFETKSLKSFSEECPLNGA